MDNEGKHDAVIKVVRAHREELFEAWMKRQLEAETLRLDLMSEAELESESKAFLAVFSAAVAAGNFTDLEAAEWHPVLAQLERLSATRESRGFSPVDTATFVLSLKQPLIELLRDEVDDENLLETVWGITALIDHLGLHTTALYQKRKEATIERQQAEMLELSTPVVKLWDGILALPLIGTLDTGRSQMVTEALLDAIVRTGSEIAIIDLTGVPAVDTRMAQHLIRTVAAARLMGAECILSGIRPQIAQTMVHLQIDLGTIGTEATLASALSQAFRRIGLSVRTKDKTS